MATEDAIREAARALRADPMDRAARERLAVAWIRAGRPVEAIGRDPREDPRPLDYVFGRTRRLVVAIAPRRSEVAWVEPARLRGMRWFLTPHDPVQVPVPVRAGAPIPPFARGGWRWASLTAWRRWAARSIDMHGAPRVLWVEPFDWGEWHLSAGGSELPEAQRRRIEQDRARRAADFFDWGSQ